MNRNSIKIQNFLKDNGLEFHIVEFPSSTKTSAEAAREIGCTISEIAKSILFKGNSGKPVLVVASGSNRINEKKIEKELGEPIKKASADFVKETTGFSIGGVPPIGHIQKIKTFFDKDLMKYEKIWAAAGTPNSVFSANPKELVKIANGKIIDIS